MTTINTNDEADLIDKAKNATDENVRKTALFLLFDPVSLADVAKNTRYEDSREGALAMLKLLGGE